MAKPNIKELVVNHFEKGIFAVACLIALAMLVGSRWAPYGHHPSEITEKVETESRNLAGHTWPEEERQQFEVDEQNAVEAIVARNIGRQVDPSPYEFDVSFSPGLYDTTKPISEPEYVGIAALIAEPGRFLMAVQPEPTSLLDSTLEDPLMADTDTTEAEDDQSDIPEEFRDRSKVPAAAGPAGAAGDPYSEYASQYGGAMSGRRGEDYGGGDYGGGDYGGYAGGEGYGDYGGYGGEGYGGMGMGMASNMEGRGLRYVAVRGIIPLREQVRKFMKTIHLSFPQASNLYEIIEFELERKKMQPGDNPWGGDDDWELVDIDIAKDVLSEALSFDPEVVQGSITDAAVTMPLPGRLMGVWKSKATHPKLENFTLSPEEIDKELQFNRMLLEQHEKQAENAPEEKVKKGGFADIAYDSRSMQMGSFNMAYGEGMMESYDYGGEGYGEGEGDYGGYGGGYGGMGGMNYAPTSQGKMTKEAQAFLDKIQKEVGNNPEDRDKALLEYITERITAQGELLLFRYFDFDVEPGATYKYRARLVVRNPNYGLPVAQVSGLAHVVEGQTRKSDWSNETEPTTIPQDVDYFVDKIDDKGAGISEARMAVFQWNPDYGTTIQSLLEVSFGEEIGGPKNTLVLDPAKNRFEVEAYTFHTGDVLVDALPEDKVSRGDHPDLELPRSARGSLGISGQVLIAQGNGELAVIDHFSRMSAFQNRRKYLEYEQQPYEDIKNREAKQPDMSELQGYGGGYGEYGGEYGGEGSYGEGGGGGEGYGGYGGGYGGASEDYGRGRRRGSGLRKNTGRSGGRPSPGGRPRPRS